MVSATVMINSVTQDNYTEEEYLPLTLHLLVRYKRSRAFFVLHILESRDRSIDTEKLNAYSWKQHDM